MCCKRGHELVENEEQGKYKKMKSIVVEEQEQEQEQEEGSETRFLDLDPDTLRNVLERVDVVTLGRAACVNKLWCRVAWDDRLWEPIIIRYWAGNGGLRYIDTDRNGLSLILWAIRLQIRGSLSDIVKPPPDFYSIDFSKKIEPWV